MYILYTRDRKAYEERSFRAHLEALSSSKETISKKSATKESGGHLELAQMMEKQESKRNKITIESRHNKIAVTIVASAPTRVLLGKE